VQFLSNSIHIEAQTHTQAFFKFKHNLVRLVFQDDILVILSIAEVTIRVGEILFACCTCIQICS